MAPPTVELDFFAINKNSSSSSQPRLNKLINRQRSFRDIQSAISKINPDVLRSVIASGSANQENANESNKCFAMPVVPKEEKTQLTALPLYPVKPVLENPLPDTAPLTIFYNGTVAVFDVPRDKAEAILKVAEKGTSRAVVDSSELEDQRQQLIETLEGDLPIARRKSLERFLEKRKERLTSISPYYCIPESRV